MGGRCAQVREEHPLYLRIAPSSGTRAGSDRERDLRVPAPPRCRRARRRTVRGARGGRRECTRDRSAERGDPARGGARALAWARAGRRGGGRIPPRGGSTPRRAATRRQRGTHRRAPRDRGPRAGRRRGGEVAGRSSTQGTDLAAADARAVPRRSAGGGAERLPACARSPCGRARHRSRTRPRETARADPAARPRARAAGGASPRLPAAGEGRRGPDGRDVPGDPTPRWAGRGDQDRPRAHRVRSVVRTSLRAGRPGCGGPRASAHRPDPRLLAGAWRSVHRDPVPEGRKPPRPRGTQRTAGPGRGHARRRTDRFRARVRPRSASRSRERRPFERVVRRGGERLPG